MEKFPGRNIGRHTGRKYAEGRLLIRQVNTVRVPHPRRVFVFAARVGCHNAGITGTSKMPYSSQTPQGPGLNESIFTDGVRKWVPHPRDALVFVARVGSHKAG